MGAFTLTVICAVSLLTVQSVCEDVHEERSAKISRLWPVTRQSIYLLQKRAVRAISNADYKASSKPLFANLKILDVFSIYSLQVSSFMYLYHNDALPISFTQIFQTGNQIHRYSTRYSDFYRPHTCRTNIKKFSILFQGPRIWNHYRTTSKMPRLLVHSSV